MISIRSAGEEDIPLIQHVAQETWPVAYGEILSRPQLEYMLDRFYSGDALLQQMRTGHKFFIADDAGFAACSIADVGEMVRLHKLYVLPGHQGQNLGKALLAAVQDWASRHKIATLELNVNRHNSAKQFYEKCGFEVVEAVDIDIGNGYFMNDWVMRRTLGLR